MNVTWPHYNISNLQVELKIRPRKVYSHSIIRLGIILKKKMLFSTVALLIITETDEEFEKIEKFSYLFVQKLSALGFTIEVRKVIGDRDDNVRENLVESLKFKDVVVTWGRLKNPRSWFHAKLCRVFEQDLVRNKKLHEYLIEKSVSHTAEDVNIPKHAKFLTSGEHRFPVIYLHRLFTIDEDVLFFQRDYECLVSHLEVYRKSQRFTKVYKISENSPVNDFLKTLSKYQNGLNVAVDSSGDVINLKLRSDDLDELNLIQCDIFKYYKDSLLKSDFFDDYEDGIFSSDDENIKEAVNCIKECFKTYSPENVFISFNGGKDCTVLLHMMAVVLKKTYPDYKEPIFCMYVKSNNPFPEVDSFIEMMKSCYNLNIITITSGIKEALCDILNDKPNLKACLMGTRRMDPFSQNLEHFKKTDNGWPEVMRVCPLLDWDYVNIWDYLIDFKVPYCHLYDEGFTSLGNTNNTIKNPALKYIEEETRKESYLPAYKLYDGSKERNGRDK